MKVKAALQLFVYKCTLVKSRYECKVIGIQLRFALPIQVSTSESVSACGEALPETVQQKTPHLLQICRAFQSEG